MADTPVRRFTGRDGLKLAYRELGDGRPLVLLHGFTGVGTHWIDQAHAATLAEHGHRVILPDLRGHGDSAHPHDPAAYPPDVLADDGLALIEQLGLDDYDLGGYSLGGRTALRMLARGARPAHAIVAGQGSDVVSRATGRTGRYHRVLNALVHEEALDPGSPEAEMAHWITSAGADPRALGLVLETHVATSEDVLRRITTPTLVAVGDQDTGHASADALAAALPHARFVQVPGNHFTAFTSPELTTAILAFLHSRLSGPEEPSGRTGP